MAPQPARLAAYPQSPEPAGDRTSIKATALPALRRGPAPVERASRYASRKSEAPRIDAGMPSTVTCMSPTEITAPCELSVMWTAVEN